MNTRRWITALAAITLPGLVALMLPASAHHASAPFYDPENVVELQGTVTRWVFRNPHAFLFIDVANTDGSSTEWQVELGAPVSIRRVGWSPETLSIGMEVSVRGQKSRADGSFGICCVRMTKADGSPVIAGGRVQEERSR